jgi:hypothetical protein
MNRRLRRPVSLNGRLSLLESVDNAIPGGLPLFISRNVDIASLLLAVLRWKSRWADDTGGSFLIDDGTWTTYADSANAVEAGTSRAG